MLLRWFHLTWLGLAIVIVGIIVMAASPQVCPTGYNDQTCEGTNGESYPCTSTNGTECSDQEDDSSYTTGGGVCIGIGALVLLAASILRCQERRQVTLLTSQQQSNNSA